uniref:C-1-tetrahydrofolate synthase, cytoplasmic n=1 Tax=Biomphalaria glabrata TaxID=6526 RepID=A0A2C9L9U0_BIOGL
MIAKIIDGKAIADKICTQIKELIPISGISPYIATILIGHNPASKIYVENKKKRAEQIGMKFKVFELPENTKEIEVYEIVKSLNNDKTINGILLQLPTPQHINKYTLLDAISPEKDIDGLSTQNAGLLFTNRTKYSIAPCTPSGCMELIYSCEKNLSGKHAVVIGRSNLVGSPMAQMLLNKNCTVTIVHSKTKNIAKECCRADIIIAAAGVKNLVQPNFVKKDAIVIDVGINRENSTQKLTGDVNFNAVKHVAGAITPVPGGVGPMTVAMLMKNTFIASLRQNGLKN